MTIGTTALLFTLTTPVWLRVEYFLGPAIWLFLLNGLVHPTLSL